MAWKALIKQSDCLIYILRAYFNRLQRHIPCQLCSVVHIIGEDFIEVQLSTKLLMSIINRERSLYRFNFYHRLFLTIKMRQQFPAASDLSLA